MIINVVIERYLFPMSLTKNAFVVMIYQRDQQWVDTTILTPAPVPRVIIQGSVNRYSNSLVPLLSHLLKFMTHRKLKRCTLRPTLQTKEEGRENKVVTEISNKPASERKAAGGVKSKADEKGGVELAPLLVLFLQTAFCKIIT